MNNHNLKRRRPFSDDLASPAGPALLDPSRCTCDRSYQLDVTSLCPFHRYIFSHAALFLEQDVSQLLETYQLSGLSPKRPRLNAQTSMYPSTSGSPAGQDEQEKSPPSGHARNRGGQDAFGSFASITDGPLSLGLSCSPLTDCFGGINACQSYSSPYVDNLSYQSIPAPQSSYGVPALGNQSFAAGLVSPLHAQGESSFRVSSGAAPTPSALFAPYEDSTAVNQYLVNYPPLQPTHASTQPSTLKEEMVYPATQADAGYLQGDGQYGDFTSTAYFPDMLAINPIDSSGHLPEHYDKGALSQMGPHSATTSPTGLVGPRRYDLVRDMHSFGLDGPGYPLGVGSYQPGSGLGVVFSSDRAPAAKRGPFKTAEERQETANTRKIGSCIRCRMQRIRCKVDPDDDQGACLSCKKVALNKIWRLPCLRAKITDVKLSKPGQVPGYEWTSRWKDNLADPITGWASSSDKYVFVTEGYTNKSVRLRVRRFIPQPGDRTTRSWVRGGKTMSVKIEPYAIVDLEATKLDYEKYIETVICPCFENIMRNKGILLDTYRTAYRRMFDEKADRLERKLLRDTLRLWMSIRLTTKSFEIVGQETLGIPPMDDDSPQPRQIPLPPVMGAQLDLVLLHQIQPALLRQCLEGLQSMTQSNKQRMWLTTYLVTFILLHNIALITAHDEGYAVKHGMKRRFAREENVRQYHEGARTLLAYFHYCNKGIYPFTENCKDQELNVLAELDENAVNFVHKTRESAIAHKKEWECLSRTDQYGNDFFFVSQLFEQNWNPRRTV